MCIFMFIDYYYNKEPVDVSSDLTPNVCFESSVDELIKLFDLCFPQK